MPTHRSKKRKVEEEDGLGVIVIDMDDGSVAKLETVQVAAKEEPTKPTKPTTDEWMRQELELPASDVPLERPDMSSGQKYEFGDSGSSWGMMKLQKVYDLAREKSQSIETVALERFGSLQEFDEAREEHEELQARKKSPSKEKKVVPDGSLYEMRGMETTSEMDQTKVNRMKAQVMRAQMKQDPNASVLEAEYQAAVSALSSAKEPAIVLNSMHTKGPLPARTSGGEDMSVADMLKEERRDRMHGDHSRGSAKQIARDGTYSNDMDYLDENAERLAKRVQRNEIDWKNMAVHEYKRMEKVLDECPLCFHDTQPPLAPVIAAGSRVYLALPTNPALARYAATIVPISHHTNTLECDDDEWDEMRNFMKCLTRMYHEMNREVLFYENAAAPHQRKHATIEAVPIPPHLKSEAPGFFREAFTSTDEEWSQHRKIINTLEQSKTQHGRDAFRKSLVKQMPYFHVWFEINGGMGHVVEDEHKWPKGDLFAREIVGGLLELDIDVWRKQGMWDGGVDSREERFKEKWHKFDWTRMLHA